MKLDKSIIVLILIAALIFIYFTFFNFKVTFELRDSVVRVNIHDTVDLKSYIFKAVDDNGKKLIDKVKINVEAGELDEFSNNKLFIGDFSNKTITYTIKYKFKTFKASMDIVVISDPNDPEFRANLDYESNDINNDDIPQVNNNSNFSIEQQNYLNSLK